MGGTCWFNAIMMMMFWSQGMRNLILSKMKDWKKDAGDRRLKTIHDTFKDILLNHYYTTNNPEVFDALYPEHMLKLLHQYDPKRFIYDATDNYVGGRGLDYIAYMLDLLHIRQESLSLLVHKNIALVHASHHDRNMSFDRRSKKIIEVVTEKKPVPPNPVFIYFTLLSTDVDEYYQTKSVFKVWDAKGHGELDLYNGVMMFNGQRYRIDSVSLANFNANQCSKGHAIAGVTCNNKRYLYNGWTNITNDPSQMSRDGNPAPCELMDYDWLRNKDDLCINAKQCKMDNYATPSKRGNLCFNFYKGPRTYFAIRDDAHGHVLTKQPRMTTPIDDSMFKKIPRVVCPPGYTKNKTTLDCVKCPNGTRLDDTSNNCIEQQPNQSWFNLVNPVDVIKTKLLNSTPSTPQPPLNRPAQVVSKRTTKTTDPAKKASEKQCPEGKVINPKTGRCIIDRSSKKQEKQCPEGKVVNPKTGRCVNKNSRVLQSR